MYAYCILLDVQLLWIMTLDARNLKHTHTHTTHLVNETNICIIRHEHIRITLNIEHKLEYVFYP